MGKNSRPEGSKVFEGNASEIFFTYIRKDILDYKPGDIRLLEADVKLELCNRYANIDGYTFDNAPDDYKKYYVYIYGHAKKNLKKEKYLANDESDKKYLNITINSPELKNELNISKISWDTNNTIKTFFEMVETKKLAIPSFQRPTAWVKEKDYSELMYSIFNWTPLGIMYFWNISLEEIKEVEHYKFKTSIDKKDKKLQFTKLSDREKTSGFKSVIDGQQRLTAMNLIINGTFDNKVMYFNETRSGRDMFKFKDVDKVSYGWKSIGEIFEKLKKIFSECGGTYEEHFNDSINTLSKEMYISIESLTRFYKAFFIHKVITVCEIKEADKHQMMDLFIRINSFGKPLSPADLSLSYITGETDNKDTRKDIENLLSKFEEIKNNVGYTTIIKLVIMYFTNDAKASYEKLILEKDFKDKLKWKNLMKALTSAVDILKSEFNGKVASANSLIPIILWIAKYQYNCTKGKEIIVETNEEIINNMKMYLWFAQFFKEFRSSTDSKLNHLWKGKEDKYPGLSESKDFSNWKLDQAMNSELIFDNLNNLSYTNNKEAIFAILKALKIELSEQDKSIEHIRPQSKDGSDKIWNLTLVNQKVNEKMSDKNISEKIEILLAEYSLNSEQDIHSKILFTEETEKREDFIINKVKEHFNLKED